MYVPLEIYYVIWLFESPSSVYNWLINSIRIYYFFMVYFSIKDSEIIIPYILEINDR